MKLYYSPGACSMAPHIVALEADHRIDLLKVDLRNKKTGNGEDYWAINPKGYVPALVLDDGTLITEAAVICQYLADQKPESGLIAPLGSMQRYEQMSALTFVATEVHKQIGALFNPALTPEMRAVQIQNIGRRLDTLEKMLAGRSHAMGEQFTAVDAYLFTVLAWAPLHKIDTAPWPNITAYAKRVGARDKVREAMVREGLIKQ